MNRILLYTAIGYLFGSLLFAKYFSSLFHKRDVLEDSPDKNPGTFNAFKYGGVCCGVLTLCCDLLKGFFPVYLYLNSGSTEHDLGLTFVLAAPVFGHILPIFHHFQGGKGIAVTFGCLLGLLPAFYPLFILAGTFLFFSLVLKITPDYHKTLFTYLLSMVGMVLHVSGLPVILGFAMITGLVLIKLFISPEKKEACKVVAAWKR